jgi:uncharacterized protein YjiS (DUF1127 family)
MKTVSKFSVATLPQGLAGQSWPRQLVAVLERRLEAFITWRFEQSAIAALSAMSDRELKDIGFNRPQIMSAVRSGAAPERTATHLHH